MRRLKTRPDASKGFQPRQVKALSFTPGDDEQETFALLDQHRHRQRQAERHGTGRRHRGDAAEEAVPVQPVLVRADACSHYRAPRPRRRPGARRRRAIYQDIFGEGQSDEEEGLCGAARGRRAARARAPTRWRPPSPASSQTLADWGLGYERRPDSRLTALIRFLDAVCRPDGSTGPTSASSCSPSTPPPWTGSKRVLAPARLRRPAGRHPGLHPAEDREYIRSQFTADPAKEPVRVLLATDAAGEGIDLQTHCHRLVNFDIPFNPSRLEQRIGRIDRYGQTEAPEVYHFAPGLPSSTVRRGRGVHGAASPRRSPRSRTTSARSTRSSATRDPGALRAARPARAIQGQGRRRRRGDHHRRAGGRHGTQRAADRAVAHATTHRRSRDAPDPGEPAPRGRHRAAHQRTSRRWSRSATRTPTPRCSGTRAAAALAAALKGLTPG